MKNKLIIVLVPTILAVLVSVYLMFSVESLINAIFSPLTGCGVLLGLLNLVLLKLPKLVFILLNIVFGIVVFALLYFVNSAYFSQYIFIGGVIGFLTGIFNTFFNRQH
ncbi:MAG: hypothetical protein JNM71_10335 [Flavobacterium lindanitolerans]|uniref:hypothetical protein n=1 Tax=Flavobacterium lindanitolerans TaxID=428988 RepID=UPI001A4AC8AF|nr:hypothetical protein [Flavobacterium lindanitolerans]MBL7868407.1 hypothetical protein [Flavobacterium lindanitolerans]